MEESEDRAVTDPLLKKLLELSRELDAESVQDVTAKWHSGSDFDDDDVAGNCDDVVENEERNGSMSAGDDDVGA